MLCLFGLENTKKDNMVTALIILAIIFIVVFTLIPYSIKYKIITSDGEKSSLTVEEKHNQKILNKILTANYLAFGYYSWIDISFDYRHKKIYIFSIEAQETIKRERTRNIEDVKEGDVIYLSPVLIAHPPVTFSNV